MSTTTRNLKLNILAGFSAGVNQLPKLAIGVGIMSAASLSAQAQAPKSPTPAPVNGVIRAETVAKGLEHPWALEFMPDGRIVVTERAGRVRIVDRESRLSKPLDGVPRVAARGQGGLLDVGVGPPFTQKPP